MNIKEMSLSDKIDMLKATLTVEKVGNECPDEEYRVANHTECFKCNECKKYAILNAMGAVDTKGEVPGYIEDIINILERITNEDYEKFMSMVNSSFTTIDGLKNMFQKEFDQYRPVGVSIQFHKYKNTDSIIFRLWKLLDDIDSAGDLFQNTPEDSMEYRKKIEELHKLRHKIVSEEDVEKLYKRFYPKKEDIEVFDWSKYKPSPLIKHDPRFLENVSKENVPNKKVGMEKPHEI